MSARSAQTSQQTPPVSNSALPCPGTDLDQFPNPRGWLPMWPQVCVKFYLPLLPANPSSPSCQRRGNLQWKPSSSPIICQTRIRGQLRYTLRGFARRPPERAQGTVPMPSGTCSQTQQGRLILQDYPGIGPQRTDGCLHTGMGLVRARQGITGVRASPTTGRRDRLA